MGNLLAGGDDRGTPASLALHDLRVALCARCGTPRASGTAFPRTGYDVADHPQTLDHKLDLEMSTRRQPRDPMEQEKLLEIYFNKLNQRPTLTLIARHEAAHAIMHYLVGLPATRLMADDHRGLCESSGRACDVRQQVLALLAGIASEVKYSAWLINLRHSKTADLEQARQLLAANVLGRRAEVRRKIYTAGVEKALRLAMERACEILEPFHDEIESLGALLAEAGRLSANRTEEFMREHIRAPRRLTKGQWQLPLGLPMKFAAFSRLNALDAAPPLKRKTCPVEGVAP